MHRSARLATLTAIALLLAPAGVRADAPVVFDSIVSPDPPPNVPGLAYEDIIPTVVINGTTVADALPMVRHAGQIYARVADLQAWRLRVDLTKTLVIAGDLYVPLTAAGLTDITFDGATQRLEATAAPTSYETSTTGAPLGVPLATQTTTLHANVRTSGPALDESYAVNADLGTDHESALYGQFNTAYDVGPGEFFTGFAGSIGGSESGFSVDRFQRLDTAYVVDNAASLSRLRIGDGQTIADAAGNPVRFGGVQYGTSFDIDPRFVTFATPTLRGTAYVPSTVQVYANGLLQYSQPVDPGNFALHDVPLAGQGSATVVVRDAAGGVHVVNEPYVSSRQLLRAGLSDYSASAGFAHIEDGFSTNRYGPFMGTANERYGVTNGVTLASHVETGDGVTEGSVETFGAIPVIGVAGLGLAESAGRGSALLANYSLERNVFGLSGDVVHRTPGFELVGDRVSQYIDPQIGTSYDVSAFAHVTGTTFRVTVSNLDQLRSGRTQLEVFSLDRTIKGNTLYVDYARTTSGGDVAHDFNIDYAFPLGPTAQLDTASAIGNAPSQIVHYISDTRSPSGGQEVDARFETDNGATPFGSLDVLRPLLFANVAYGATGSAAGATVEGGVSGSIVRFFGRTVAMPTLGDAFILVRTGYANVRVKVNGFEVGRTDARGDLVTSSIVPLENNVVTLDPNDVPESVTANLSQNVVPPRRGGAVVVFADTHTGAVAIHLVRSDGGAVLVGAVVSGEGGPWPVGADGFTYLSGVKAGPLPIVVDLGYKRTCRATVAIPSDVKNVPDLGTVRCDVSQ